MGAARRIDLLTELTGLTFADDTCPIASSAFRRD
jgi:hypothetical protein